jgi:hypothetical protein
VRVRRLLAPASPAQAQTSSNDRPPCLENSRRAPAEHDSLPKTATFHFTLNQDPWGNRGLQMTDMGAIPTISVSQGVISNTTPYWLLAGAPKPVMP